MRILIILTFMSLKLMAMGFVGFEVGNKIEIYTKEGNVTFNCVDYDIPMTRTIFCKRKFISTESYSRFKFDMGLKVDQVKLIGLRSDGKEVVDSSAFDWEKSVSKKAFNLLKDGWFRTPFLKPGINVISYELYYLGKLQHRGSFKVSVNLLDSIYCHDARYTGTHFDCNEYYQLCENYYRDKKYCPVLSRGDENRFN